MTAISYLKKIKICYKLLPRSRDCLSEKLKQFVIE